MIEHPIDEYGTGGFSPESFSEAMSGIERWARRYLDSLADRPVGSERAPGETLGMLPGEPPEIGEGMDLWGAIGSEIESVIEPGLVHWQSPRFFAYFPCSSSLPGVMGELASAVMNVNGMLWSTSPSATELEMRMLDWCASLFGLPEAFRFDTPGSLGGGCIQGTASEGVLAALCAARKRMVNAGHDRTKMTLYTSTQAHSSILKSAMVAGLADSPEDRSRVRLIETDASLRMDAGRLCESIHRDISEGLTPCLVSTTQGTTSTGACDPLVEIGRRLGEIEENRRPWLHVDAAWGGAAAVCAEHRGLIDGIDRADSICINPHKWLLTNFDCDLFWVRDRSALTDSMSITPAYLRNEQSESGGVIDFRDWHVPLGRRMRAIKLWFVLRYFGRAGLERHIRHHVALAESFEAFVHSEPRLEMACPRVLGLVCFVVSGEDEKTKELIDRINTRKRVMVSHTRVPVGEESGVRRERWVARVAIGSASATQADLRVLQDEIHAVLDEVV